MNRMSQEKEALKKLTGLVTADGWTIGEFILKQSYQTGGAFSVGYVATHADGRHGFLKALDFSRAVDDPDPVRALQRMTSIYNFERDVLALCRGARLSKIVTAISDGTIDVDDAAFGKVFYLIFEMADGDVRKKAVLSNQFDIAWTVRAIQHIATGVSQLHKNDIFHQDLKPSNVLVFGKDEVSKLADLGRSHCKSLDAPHDHLVLAGARFYAPPEQVYNFELPDRSMARAAADIYLLGSVIYFLFMGSMLTPTVVDNLRPEHKPPIFAKDDRGWMGYFADVLPYYREAHAKAMNDFAETVRAAFHQAGVPAYAEELIQLLGYLVEPDPRDRGHPHERRQKHSNPYAMQRFISALNKIATACELNFKRFNAEAA